MGIRNKTLLIVLAFLVVMVGGFVAVMQTVQLRGFGQVESNEMTKNVQRAVDAVDYTMTQMSAKGSDWSGWSETYKFVKDHNQDYIDANLVPDTLAGQHYNFMGFYNTKGKLVYGTGVDIEKFETIDYPESLKQFLVPTNPILAVPGDYQEHRGLVMLPEGPLLLVTRSILDTNEDPTLKSDGTIVFGTYLNDTRVAELSSLTELPLKFYAYDATNLPADVKNYRQTTAAAAGKLAITPLSDKTVAGYSVVKDIAGQPALIVSVQQPRSSFQQGQRTLLYSIYLMVAIGVVLAVVLGWLLNRFVVGPVQRLAQDVGGIEGRSKSSYRVRVPKQRDEVGRLAEGINNMLGNLEQARSALEHEKSLVEEKVVERTRELAEAQAELTASIKSLPFGFAVISQHDQIVFSNELLGKLVNHPIPADPAATTAVLRQMNTDYEGVLDIMDCIHEAQQTRKPIERQVSMGPRFFRFFFMPVLSGEAAHQQVVGTVLLMEDVTEEKALQRSRDEFFSIASHELRTPLTAIRGNSSMLIQYYRDDLKDPDAQQMLADIHGGSLRLIDIVNDFLDMSRLEMGKIEFKPEAVDAVELAQQVVREYDVTGSRKKLQLKVESKGKGALLAVADKDRLRQVMVNLLSNGIKFTEQGGVTIGVESAGKKVRIRMTDTGVGISPEQQHLLFRKFQQAGDSILTRNDTQSTGLGLYISKLLAEGMGGTVALESSEVGKGSTFVVELPQASKRADKTKA